VAKRDWGTIPVARCTICLTMLTSIVERVVATIAPLISTEFTAGLVLSPLFCNCKHFKRISPARRLLLFMTIKLRRWIFSLFFITVFNRCAWRAYYG
jgi:hypothetical protein